MWISHSERPYVDELGYTLGAERVSTGIGISNVSVMEIALGCALGLVTVEAPPSIIHLFRFAPQEYFFDNPAFQQLTSDDR